MTEQTLAQKWAERIEKLELSKIDPLRPVTSNDIQYLLKRYPYLQILNSDTLCNIEPELKLIPAQSGWSIHDYGDMIIASSGESLYGGSDDKKFLESLLNPDKDDDSDGDTVFLPGKGTIVKQMVDTAFEIINIAIEKGWVHIDIIAGTELMRWAAWFEAQEKEVEIFGFDPKEEDETKRKRIMNMLSTEKVSLQPKI